MRVYFLLLSKKKLKKTELESNKNSNKISNTKKAQGQVILSGLSLAIGAILAPLTGGLSLIPTAFVVFYGNTAALAMYGGSQYFIDDKQKQEKNNDHDQPKPDPDKPYSSPIHSNNDEIPLKPNLTPANSLASVIADDELDSAGVRSDKINQRIVDDMQKIGEATTPEHIIQRDNNAIIEHQAKSEIENNNFEWVMLVNDDDNLGHQAALMEAFELAPKLPIVDCINYSSNRDPISFTSSVEETPELRDLNIELDPSCIATNIIHLDDNIKIFAIRNIADIQSGEPQLVLSEQPEQLEQLNTPIIYQSNVKKAQLIVTSQRGAGSENNPSEGVRGIIGKTNNRVEPTLSALPEQSVGPIAPKPDTSTTTPDSTDAKNNDANESAALITPEVTKPISQHTVKMPAPIITSQGSSGLGDNRSAGVRNNTGKTNNRVEPTLSALPEQSVGPIAPKPDTSTTTPDSTGAKNNDANESAALITPEVTKPISQNTVKMPAPIVTSQGSSELGDNRSAGVRNNTGKTNNRVEPTLSALPEQSVGPIAPKPDTSTTTPDSTGAKNNDANESAELITPEVTKPISQHTVKMPAPIVTSQGSSGLGDNRSAGVRNNTGKTNNDASDLGEPILVKPIFTPKREIKTAQHVVTSQGSPELGDNRSAGVRNNPGKIHNNVEPTSLTFSKHPIETRRPISNTSITTPNSIDTKNNDANNLIKSIVPKATKPVPHYMVTMPKLIVTSQGSAGLGSNRSVGIRNNMGKTNNDASDTEKLIFVEPILTSKQKIKTAQLLTTGLEDHNSAGIAHDLKAIHDENVSKIADIYWKNTGIDKEGTLNIFNNNLVTRSVNVDKLDYEIEKNKAS
ncbi:hypothetical protein [Providencia burhodogranariea]|uniref:Uncharacterized protein n=1 Tax=Providencia burhodogranariea DSM 19968 TaxID=1141662 RepID=K8WVC1_9GAMM|nr:hypothetical protein [Providencia burhodogranariea]EKT64614.1 hypothetical protein OOA_02417 [Providencia burhodogranariea DSM 19968]